MGHHRDQLVGLLRQKPNNAGLQTLIERVEYEQRADLTNSADLLRGVWELYWSSSQQPWLRPSAGLENLQILDPEHGRGCNLLRLRGSLSALGGIRVQAEVQVAGSQRVMVCFPGGLGQPLLTEPRTAEFDAKSSAEHAGMARHHRAG